MELARLRTGSPSTRSPSVSAGAWRDEQGVINNVRVPMAERDVFRSVTARR